MENNKKKIRSKEEKRVLLNRIARIEGQIRGVKKMMEADAYCIDLLTQLSATEAATHSLSMLILKEHIETCVKTELLGGNDAALEELCQVIKRFTK